MATRPLHTGIAPDDLMILLAITQTRTISAAAERLGVDHSTVSRHVRRMEKRIGRRLFDRTPAGWDLTDVGQALYPVAEQLQHSLEDADRVVECGSRHDVAGAVRLLTPEAFGAYLAPRALARPLAKHHALRIELLTTTRHLDLGSGEYDVAVSVEPPPTRAVASRRLCTYSLGLFASSGYLCDHAPVTQVSDLRDHRLVYYLDSHLDIATLRVLDELVPGTRPTVQSNSVSAQIQAVLSGLGIGLLPSYVAHHHPGLVPVLRAEVEIAQQYWLVIPTAVQHAARIRAVTAALVDHVVQALQPPSRSLDALLPPLSESRKKATHCPPTKL
ncbi:LysR family transcriptional regulator [Gordonia sp. PP30]|uniref:LysR family transcriptional regulator n=1 Tax=Gordonia sp. PP30 TaxID=2935861 RepID=UPI001FFE7CD2|nr:LysR family transcriptional regulator [Gordonia sp. PP30]UQE76633.1 LysR family transcriptional regulator [Gordonia sp. PP30]